jgi:hypothetical protein
MRLCLLMFGSGALLVKRGETAMSSKRFRSSLVLKPPFNQIFLFLATSRVFPRSFKGPPSLILDCKSAPPNTSLHLLLHPHRSNVRAAMVQPLAQLPDEVDSDSEFDSEPYFDAPPRSAPPRSTHREFSFEKKNTPMSSLRKLAENAVMQLLSKALDDLFQSPVLADSTQFLIYEGVKNILEHPGFMREGLFHSTPKNVPD